MTIDIRGTNTVNKGAQLMLEAVAERLSPHFSMSAPPVGSSFEIRARLGLQQTLHEYRWPRAATTVGNLAPPKLKDRFGLVSDRQIDGVVDASGFAYSDSFDVGRSRREAIYGRRWKARGVPKVMLPQAFGPMTNPRIARWATEVLQQSDLIFARDSISEGYLRSLGLTTPIERCTDFTIGLRPLPIDPLSESEFAAIVPNMKMITTGKIRRDNYVEELVGYAKAIQARGLEVVFVVHELGDREISLSCAARVGARTFESQDPRKLKAAIGQSSLLVASRFHAVVGGLSQGVPTLALGWSHKYEELLNDFGVGSWITRPDDNPDDRVGSVLSDTQALMNLKERKLGLLDQVDRMWSDTIGILLR